jgi:hypothetical protein
VLGLLVAATALLAFSPRLLVPLAPVLVDGAPDLDAPEAFSDALADRIDEIEAGRASANP